MDIFTTALTRIVPVPIKPASLKVKALLKEAAMGELKEDENHLENHDYFVSSANQQQSQQQDQQSEQQTGKQTLAKDVVEISKQDIEVRLVEDQLSKMNTKTKSTLKKSDEHAIKRLDIYI